MLVYRLTMLEGWGIFTGIIRELANKVYHPLYADAMRLYNTPPPQIDSFHSEWNRLSGREHCSFHFAFPNREIIDSLVSEALLKEFRSHSVILEIWNIDVRKSFVSNWQVAFRPSESDLLEMEYI